MQFLFLVGRLIKIISSETAWANIVKYYRKHLWKTLYKISSFFIQNFHSCFLPNFNKLVLWRPYLLCDRHEIQTFCHYCGDWLTFGCFVPMVIITEFQIWRFKNWWLWKPSPVGWASNCFIIRNSEIWKIWLLVAKCRTLAVVEPHSYYNAIIFWMEFLTYSIIHVDFTIRWECRSRFFFRFHMYYVLNYNSCAVLPQLVSYTLQRVIKSFKFHYSWWKSEKKSASALSAYCEVDVYNWISQEFHSKNYCHFLYFH
jgi:hypothetical protein